MEKKLKPNSPEAKLLDAIFGKLMSGNCKECGEHTDEGIETPIKSGKMTCPKCMNRLIGGNDEEEILFMEVTRTEARLLFRILTNTKVVLDEGEQKILGVLLKILAE